MQENITVLSSFLMHAELEPILQNNTQNEAIFLIGKFS